MYDSNVSKYIIYKFQWRKFKRRDKSSEHGLPLTAEEESKIHREMDFKKAFINRFCSENYEQLFKYSFMNKYLNENPPVNPLPTFQLKIVPFVQYEKYWFHHEHEIGLDMLEKEYGIVQGMFRSCSWYLWVPKQHTEMIEWVEKNKPDFVTIKKRI